MCMTVNDYETKKFVKRNKEKKEITVWKVYLVRQDVVSPCWMTGIGPVQHGWIKSNRSKQYNDCQDVVPDEFWHSEWHIYRGIHVFFTRKDAREYAAHYENVFKCKAQISDLVAIGGLDRGSHDRAVFMKIRISKKDFEKGKKGRN